jgi:hypothetical protein
LASASRSSKDHRLGGPVAGQRLAGRIVGQGEGVAHPAILERLEPSGHVTHFAGNERGARLHAGPKDADFDRLDPLRGGHQHKRALAAHLPVDHPHVGDHALVGIVVGIKDERAQRLGSQSPRRRDVLDHCAQHGVDAGSLLG